MNSESAGGSHKSGIEKRRAFLINVFFVAALLILVYLFYQYGLPFCMPFLIAWLVAQLAEPLIRLLCKRGLKRGVASILSLLVVFTLFAWLSIVVISRIAYEAAALRELTPAISEFIINMVDTTADALEGLFSLLPSYVSAYVQQTATSLIETLPSYIGSLAMPFLTGLTSVAASLPNLLVVTLITLTACMMISMDIPRIRAFIDRQIPPEARVMVMESKQFLLLTIGRLLRSYVVIIAITFVELFVGFSLMRLEVAALLAGLICVVDILPILGCGTILVPWAIIAFLVGDIRQGISILVLYLVITAARQFIEPRIVGGNIGLHPLLALISFYFGLKTLGVLGMFVMPVVFIMVKFLHDKGYIHIWTDEPNTEEDEK